MATGNDQEIKSEDESGPATKLLRTATSRTMNSRNQAILLPVCIICNKEKSLFTDVVSVLLKNRAALSNRVWSVCACSR